MSKDPDKQELPDAVKMSVQLYGHVLEINERLIDLLRITLLDGKQKVDAVEAFAGSIRSSLEQIDEQLDAIKENRLKTLGERDEDGDQ